MLLTTKEPKCEDKWKERVLIKYCFFFKGYEQIYNDDNELIVYWTIIN